MCRSPKSSFERPLLLVVGPRAGPRDLKAVLKLTSITNPIVIPVRTAPANTPPQRTVQHSATWAPHHYVMYIGGEVVVERSEACAPGEDIISGATCASSRRTTTFDWLIWIPAVESKGSAPI